MMNHLRKLVPVLVLAGGLAAWASACKQQEGDRCQINSDCEEPLICNQATQECSRTMGGGIDASVPDIIIDAPVELDASVDALPDASDDN